MGEEKEDESIFMRKYIFLSSFSFLCLTLLFVYQNFKYFDGKLHIVFCDVGQGDGVYIRTPSGADVTIDAGPNNGKFEKCLESHRPFYDNKLEFVFATHPDADHIGGLVSLFERYKVDSFATIELEKETGIFSQIKSLVREKKIKEVFIGEGDNFIFSDGMTVATYWPNKELLDNAKFKHNIDYNSFSLVQNVAYGSFSYLATGDVTFENLNLILPEILSETKDISVFKLPHHGSHTGVNEATFGIFKPSLSVISSGRNNRYGHPHPSVISELKRNGLRYLRTDELGSIEVISDGRKFEIEY